MKSSYKFKKIVKSLVNNVWLIIIIWSLILSGLFTRDYYLQKRSAENLAIREARAHFQKDEAFRFWSTTHGGFYVPISKRTPQNKYLKHVFERDIETPSGVKLTLMNPAYALRQMNEDFADTYGVVGHITSLKLLRPENVADDWEVSALKSFEKGNNEVLEFSDINNKPFLRLMKPLITQKGCLKCHSHQNYKVGDVRGGVSVSVPLTEYLTKRKEVIRAHAWSYFIIYLIGIGIIFTSFKIVNKNNSEKNKAQKMLKESYSMLETKVLERTKELIKINDKLQTETIEHIASKELIKESENKIKSIFRAAPTGIGLVVDRKIQFVNDKFCKMIKYSAEELIGHNSDMVYPSKDEFERVGKYKYEQIEKNGSGTIETQFLRKDGLKIDVLLSSTPVDLNNLSKGVTFTALDISDRIKNEQELEKYRNHLEEQIKIRTQKIYTLNEELKASNEELNTTNEKLKESNKDLEEYNQLFIGREFRIKELRDRIKELEAKL